MNYKKKVLKNGMRIITVPMCDNQTVTVAVLVEAGSKYENKENNGISHFLEHMTFKGTEKRPTSFDINSEFDGMGAQNSAFTSEEFTGYWAKAHVKHTNKIIDVISDMYLNPVFDKDEIKKEKGVVIEEINMYRDLPQREVHSLFAELLYGDQPVGRPILGPKQNIKNMSREDFLDYRDAHYVAEATTVIVAGNIEEKEVVKEIEKRFKDIKTSKHHKKLKVKDAQNKPQAKVEYKKTDQTHFVLGMRAFKLSHKDSIVASVIAGVLSGGMSARLFQKLRDEMGVCYYVRASNDALTDHGIFDISSGVDNKRVKEVIEVILKELDILKTELVSDKELKKVKEKMIGGLFLTLESSDAWTFFYGEQEILRQPIVNAKEKAKEVKKVSAKDIQRVAKNIFKTEQLNLALIGPFKKEAEFLSLLKF